ncbi:MAG: polyphosphate kinase 1 [Acidobacteriaceae bacterium]
MPVRKQSAPQSSTRTSTRTSSSPRASALHPQSTAAGTDGRFIDRDESWLQFNRRVLEEADDPSNPILERVKFLAISASNLDEFVEIRLAGILQRLEENQGLPQHLDPAGLTQAQRMERLRNLLHQFTNDQNDCWNLLLQPELKRAGISILDWKQLRKTDREFAVKFFQEQVDPLLTPVTLDPSHPFPRVLNKALCLALLLRSKRRRSGNASKVLGVITIPRSLPWLVALPERSGRLNFLLLEQLIRAHLPSMFRGYAILHHSVFRVTRNSNLYMQEEEARSILETVAEELHNRRKGDAVRIEIGASASEEIVERLRTNFELEPWQVFRTSAPINLNRLMALYSAVKLPELKFREFHGRRLHLEQSTQPAGSIFAELHKGDILLHHPYDSYSTVENFIASAASDPNVISIKQTLYRTSPDSPIFSALKAAAQSKDVTVVVELMARFDEASNIRWARELEDAGGQVFHGIFGFKTHCKLALIVRRDSQGAVHSYAHLGTGNYNPVTARFYTDISLLTARPDFTEAVLRVFRYLTAEWDAGPDAYRPLLLAPVTLNTDFLTLIAREAEHARNGLPARIIAKINGLLDPAIIEALYTASQAGVEIDLIVRGMCALRPSVPGLSERIRVRSILGRFLEHSRIFWFANAGQEEVFCGSADWMTRNLHERCEVVFPVLDPAIQQRLRQEILEAYLTDNLKARIMLPDGSYHRAPRSAPPLCAQDLLMQISHSQQERPGHAQPAAKPVLVETAPEPSAEEETILTKEQSGL